MTTPSIFQHKRPRLRLRGLVAVAILAIGAALVLAACGGGGSPQGAAGGSTSGNGSSQASTSGSGALKFAECMRAHGISNFPDPPSSGGPQQAPSGLSPNSPQFLSAESACAHYEKGGNPASNPQNQQQLLKYAQCMRTHGVTNFPDPNSSGGFSSSPGSNLNPNSSQFQSAMQVCQSLLPGSK